MLAGHVSDEWRQALGQSTSPLHIIDRFSVHVNFSRCIAKELLAQIEPNAPSLKLEGNLPALTCNLSETKLVSLLRCTSFPPSPASMQRDGVQGESAAKAVVKRRLKETDRRVMVADFTIDRISVEVYGGPVEQDRLVGLVVRGLRAEMTQRTFDEQLSFVVEDILAEDHTQPAGSEFYRLITTESHSGLPFLTMTYTHLASKARGKGEHGNLPIYICVCIGLGGGGWGDMCMLLFFL